jgi:hypothetical protein
LIPYLEAEGFKVAYPDYGYEFALATKAVNPMLVGALFPYVEAGDCYVGHSNGCAIGYELMRRGAQVTAAAFINAALDAWVGIPPQLKALDVYFNEGDQITEIASFGARLGILDPVWGEMGHTGYSGTDLRVINHDCGVGPAPCFGHSAIFEPGRIEVWGPVIAKNLREKCNG